MNKYFLVLAICFISVSSRAETIGEMLSYCQKADGNSLRSHCHSYISGVIDVQATYELESPTEIINTCFPTGVTARQGAAIFVKWAKGNPETHHKFVHFGVIKSLNEAFPCPVPPKP